MMSAIIGTAHEERSANIAVGLSEPQLTHIEFFDLSEVRREENHMADLYGRGTLVDGTRGVDPLRRQTKDIRRHAANSRFPPAAEAEAQCQTVWIDAAQTVLHFCKPRGIDERSSE